MLRAIQHAARGAWPEEGALGVVSLDFDDRHRRRIRLETEDGEAVLLDLPRAVAMADGDGVGTADGQWVRIQAKPEPLLAITAANPLALLKLAWHLGNRHTPAAVEAGRILIRPDHVLAAMVEGLGGSVAETVEPFQPEGGAYGDGHGHGHSHGHDHDHDHHHDHHHGHSHD